MKSFSVRISVAALAAVVVLALAACMNPVARHSGANTGGLSVSATGATNSRSVTPAANAKESTGRLLCNESLTHDSSPGIVDPHWIGTLTGCALDGATVEFWEKPNNYVVGKTEHFFEKMRITLGKDTIAGDDAGVWNFSTFKFRADGRVTGATGPWAYLDGYKAHEMGYTTAAPPPPGTYVVKGTATVWLAP